MQRFIYARHPKVVGKTYDRVFQKAGKLEVGQVKPVRNTAIGVTKRRRTKTVSLFAMALDQVNEKKIISAT